MVTADECYFVYPHGHPNQRRACLPAPGARIVYKGAKGESKSGSIVRLEGQQLIDDRGEHFVLGTLNSAYATWLGKQKIHLTEGRDLLYLYRRAAAQADVSSDSAPTDLTPAPQSPLHAWLEGELDGKEGEATDSTSTKQLSAPEAVPSPAADSTKTNRFAWLSLRNWSFLKSWGNPRATAAETPAAAPEGDKKKTGAPPLPQPPRLFRQPPSPLS